MVVGGEGQVREERVFSASYTATGRRKTAVARVVLRPGTGKILINNRPAEEYLPTEILVQAVHEPFEVTRLKGRFDAFVKARGGGFAGQAGAARHAISRALSLIDEGVRTQLKLAGLLTRDARMKERKKAGQPGARKKFQFSKR
ncbi:MAG: 30S ribosomal protein S9 [bacterium]|nr:30S ribosomal protein S9 [bacterium]